MMKTIRLLSLGLFFGLFFTACPRQQPTQNDPFVIPPRVSPLYEEVAGLGVQALYQGHYETLLTFIREGSPAFVYFSRRENYDHVRRVLADLHQIQSWGFRRVPVPERQGEIHRDANRVWIRKVLIAYLETSASLLNNPNRDPERPGYVNFARFVFRSSLRSRRSGTARRKIN